MITPEVENFLSCYLETLQIIPQEMQVEISAYLQTDLQHQHLLKLCKGYIESLKRSTSSTEQKTLARKLVFCLGAIQDICDRRMPIVGDMSQLLETQTHKLLSLRSRLHSDPVQPVISETESNDKSDCEIDEADNHDIIVGTSDASCAKYPLEQTNTDSRTTSSTLKRKARPSFRTPSQTCHVSASRRSLKQWGSSSRRSKNGSAIRARQNSLHPIKRCVIEHHVVVQPSRSAPRPHSYSRYGRTQQRLKSQQRHQQRVLSRTVDGDRNAPGRRLSKLGTDNRNTNAEKHLDPKFKRTLVSSRANSGNTDWTIMDNYFDDEDPNTRSASNISSEDEGGTHASRVLSGNHHSRKLDHNMCSSWAKVTNRSSEEPDNSVHTDNNEDEENSIGDTSLHMREIKSYYNKNQRPRLSSPSSNLPACRNRTTTTVAPRHLSRPTKRPSERDRSLTDDSYVYRSSESQSVGSERTEETPGSSFVRESAGKRRNRNLLRFRQYPRSLVRNSPDLLSAHDVLVNSNNATLKNTFVPRSPNRSNNETRLSDVSDLSSDERLYCWCKKVSFGDMIACDNKHCSVEWFHFECVGIHAQPKGKWYCPLCRGESSKMKRSDI